MTYFGYAMCLSDLAPVQIERLAATYHKLSMTQTNFKIAEMLDLGSSINDVTLFRVQVLLDMCYIP